MVLLHQKYPLLYSKAIQVYNKHITCDILMVNLFCLSSHSVCLLYNSIYDDVITSTFVAVELSLNRQYFSIR